MRYKLLPKQNDKRKILLKQKVVIYCILRVYTFCLSKIKLLKY